MLLVADETQDRLLSLSDSLCDYAGSPVLISDFDSTEMAGEALELILEHAFPGQAEAMLEDIQRIRRLGMDGQISFEESLGYRLGKLEGITLDQLYRAAEQFPVMPGLHEVRKLVEAGFVHVIISGGFHRVIERYCETHGISVHLIVANHLEIADDRLTGRLQGPLISDKGLVFNQVSAVLGGYIFAAGDGYTDREMLAGADSGIAVNPTEGLHNYLLETGLMEKVTLRKNLVGIYDIATRGLMNYRKRE